MVNTYNLDHIFQALSDPTRRAMLRALTRKETPVTEIAEPFRMSLAAVSKHVKVLERARLVTRRKVGSYSYLSLNGAAMRSVDEWVAYYEKFWAGRLRSLKKLVEEKP